VGTHRTTYVSNSACWSPSLDEAVGNASLKDRLKRCVFRDWRRSGRRGENKVVEKVDEMRFRRGWSFIVLWSVP
jgi:hypothetical protein